MSYLRKDEYGLRLPRKSVVRLADSLNMTIVVDWEVKPHSNKQTKASDSVGISIFNLCCHIETYVHMYVRAIIDTHFFHVSVYISCKVCSYLSLSEVKPYPKCKLQCIFYCPKYFKSCKFGNEVCQFF